MASLVGLESAVSYDSAFSCLFSLLAGLKQPVLQFDIRQRYNSVTHKAVAYVRCTGWSVCTPMSKGWNKTLNFSTASILARAIFPTSPFVEAVALFLHCPSDHRWSMLDIFLKSVPDLNLDSLEDVIFDFKARAVVEAASGAVPEAGSGGGDWGSEEPGPAVQIQAGEWGRAEPSRARQGRDEPSWPQQPRPCPERGGLGCGRGFAARPGPGWWLRERGVPSGRGGAVLGCARRVSVLAVPLRVENRERLLWRLWQKVEGSRGKGGSSA